MKKVLFLLGLIIIISCSDDNKQTPIPDSTWTSDYPWLREIMQKAENGEYKDGSGKKAMVTIRVGEVEQQYYFALQYGHSSLYFDEVRNESGEITTDYPIDIPFLMIYPLDESNKNTP